MHAKAVEAEQASRLTPAKRIQKSQLGSTVAKASAQLQNKIAKLMINVFNDAKKLTLSAWSWPSREIANMIAAGLDFQEEFSAFNPPPSVFQYITPSQHKAFLKCIVVADQDNVKSKLEKCLALSLRCDGSVDRRRIDNCHVIAKIINQEGKLEVLFLGLAEPKDRGTQGYVQAVKDAVSITSNWKSVAEKMTSLVTDGTNLNTGHKKSLWATLTEEHTEFCLPLIKVWCTAHRMDLAW